MADRRLAAAGAAEQPQAPAIEAKARPYAYYALALLMVANFFNYVDRHIVSIVAHSVQQELHFTDAQLGFLLGTAFAVLFGLLGVPMGRIADAVSRPKLMALGLAAWSAMTAASGLAGSFATLAAARIGVGIGEAVASPCSQSMVSEYFPARNRSAALGALLMAIHVGMAAALIIGGVILQMWPRWCGYLPGGACGVAAWRAAFFAVGLPGLLLAVLVAALREPPRPAPATKIAPLRLAAKELSAAVPPFTLLNVFELGGWPAVRQNLTLAAGVAAAAGGLIVATGDWAQWVAVGVGVYALATWTQVIARRDPALSKLTFACPTFLGLIASSALIGCITSGIHMWGAPYAIRTLGVSPGEVGLWMGGIGAISGGLSVFLGGLIADRWKRRDRRAPMWMGLIAVFGPLPAMVVMMQAHDFAVFVAGLFAFNLFGLCWGGAFGALVQDLVLPRMRATAAGSFSLITLLVSSSIGPYWAGKISTLTGSLTAGLYSLVALVPVAATVIVLTARRLPRETAEARLARALAAGEPSDG